MTDNSFTEEELKSAMQHMKSELGSHYVHRFNSPIKIWDVNRDIALQRRELAQAGMITPEDPYPKATLDFSKWGIVNPAFERHGKGYTLEENEKLLNHYLGDAAEQRNRDAFKAKPEYESGLAAACSYLRGGRVHKTALTNIGVSDAQRWKIDKAITKELAEEARQQKALESDAVQKTPAENTPPSTNIDAASSAHENLKSPDFGIV